MMQDWNIYRDSLLERVGDYAKQSPNVIRGLVTIDNAATKTGKLEPNPRTDRAGRGCDHALRWLHFGAHQEDRRARCRTGALGVRRSERRRRVDLLSARHRSPRATAHLSCTGRPIIVAW